MNNYVVLRRSPDWSTFDIEQTRQFCLGIGLDETLIVDYAAEWNAAMAINFTAYRQGMKEIALSCAHAVQNATVIDHAALADTPIVDDDLLYFTDDDDWVTPGLFSRLRGQEASRDGWIWRSLAVTKPFASATAESVLVDRPISSAVFTNNYAVTGRALSRLGVEALLEHYDAETARTAGIFDPTHLDEGLTAANKHMCCTTFISRPKRVGRPLPPLRTGLEAFQSDLSQIELRPEEAWLATPLSALSRINASALGQVGGL